MAVNDFVGSNDTFCLFLGKLRVVVCLFFQIIHNNSMMMAIGVTFIFWGLMKYDMELLMSRNIPIPVTVMHLQHTFPLVTNILDYVFFRKAKTLWITNYFVFILLSPKF